MSEAARQCFFGLQTILFEMLIPQMVIVIAIQMKQPEAARMVEMVFSFMLASAFSIGLAKIMFRYPFKVVNGGDVEPFGTNGLYYQIIGMSATIMIQPIITLILGNCKSIKDTPTRDQPELLDSDVLAEMERVQSGNTDDLISVNGLVKQFKVNPEATGENQDAFANSDSNNENGILKAVRGISFGLKKQESFILLGVNGAGKSTTFKCLTTEERPSTGQIMIDGIKI